MINVSETLDNLNLAFEDKGSRYLMLCPFHSEKTPSFSVFKDSGHYKCFGCGVTGSLNDLVFKLSGKSLHYDTKNQFKLTEKTQYQKHIIDDYSIEGELFSVFSNQKILDYCWKIGFSNEFLKYFNVQYSQQFRFISKYLLEEKPKKYFYNRIIIPCYNNRKILNYECRDYTKKSSVKVLYPKGADNNFLFNFDNIDIHKPLVVTEGIKSLSHIWEYYTKNTVSTFGKILKDGQKEQLLLCDKIIRFLDNDENKIDKKTKKPVDNISICIDEMDSFYSNEYEIAYSPHKGFDPANLNRETIKQVLDNRKTSSQIIIDNSHIFEVEKQKFKIFY